MYVVAGMKPAIRHAACPSRPRSSNASKHQVVRNAPLLSPWTADIASSKPSNISTHQPTRNHSLQHHSKRTLPSKTSSHALILITPNLPSPLHMHQNHSSPAPMPLGDQHPAVSALMSRLGCRRRKMAGREASRRNRTVQPTDYVRHAEKSCQLLPFRCYVKQHLARRQHKPRNSTPKSTPSINSTRRYRS